MSLIGLILLILFAIAIAYLSHVYLPRPANWIVAGLVIVVLLVVFLQVSGVVGGVGDIQVGTLR